MKKEKAEELLAKWQKRLGLQDWNIRVYTNCSPEDFEDKDSGSGECVYNEIHKVALIKIEDPIYYGERVIPFNFEQILLHELLHIKFCFIENSGNDLQDRLVHQLIEDLAKAFVNKN